ncbi:MAG: ADP-glyceromanno-heptose 6-epimerase [Gemmatimonadaceae bacterium]|nr:ADP-glyceromanno-heptose 6-epimerase [Gemmatimonadaceae bacterium]
MLDLSKARVLVTGGAGFIGSALVWALNLRGCDSIVVVDFLGQTDKWRHLRPLRFEDYVEADDLADQLCDDRLGKFDLVLHMGACSSTTETDAAYLIRNNYQYTKDLAGYALKSGARFVYASSAATYGDGSAGMSDSAELEYLHTLRPLNMYGYSKHLFDVHAAHNGWLEKIAGLKYFNVYGPNEDHKGDMRSLVHKAYGQVVETGRIRLFHSHRDEYGHGEQQRDFLYVKDAVDMTLHIAAGGHNGLYNIGSGRAATWNSLANAVFSALGKDPKIEYFDMPEELREKYQYFTQADISRLRKTEYAREVTSLDEAVRDYVQSYLVLGKQLGE